MKIKRIKRIRINAYDFKVTWDRKVGGASFSFSKYEIVIGTKNNTDLVLLELVTHELLEICAVEHGVRYHRQDCGEDYLFSYDHRQHTSMVAMLAGLLAQFIV